MPRPATTLTEKSTFAGISLAPSMVQRKNFTPQSAFADTGGEPQRTKKVKVRKMDS